MEVIKTNGSFFLNDGRNVNSHVRFYTWTLQIVYNGLIIGNLSCCMEKILDPYKEVKFNFSLKTLLFEHLP